MHIHTLNCTSHCILKLSSDTDFVVIDEFMDAIVNLS